MPNRNNYTHCGMLASAVAVLMIACTSCSAALAVWAYEEYGHEEKVKWSGTIVDSRPTQQTPTGNEAAQAKESADPPALANAVVIIVATWPDTSEGGDTEGNNEEETPWHQEKWSTITDKEGKFELKFRWRSCALYSLSISTGEQVVWPADYYRRLIQKKDMELSLAFDPANTADAQHFTWEGEITNRTGSVLAKVDVLVRCCVPEDDIDVTYADKSDTAGKYSLEIPWFRYGEYSVVLVYLNRGHSPISSETLTNEVRSKRESAGDGTESLLQDYKFDPINEDAPGDLTWSGTVTESDSSDITGAVVLITMKKHDPGDTKLYQFAAQVNEKGDYAVNDLTWFAFAEYSLSIIHMGMVYDPPDLQEIPITPEWSEVQQRFEVNKDITFDYVEPSTEATSIWNGSIQLTADTATGLAGATLVVDMAHTVDGKEVIATFADVTDSEGKYNIEFTWDIRARYSFSVLYNGEVFILNDLQSTQLSQGEWDEEVQGYTQTRNLTLFVDDPTIPLNSSWSGQVTNITDSSKLAGVIVLLELEMDDEHQLFSALTNSGGMYEVFFDWYDEALYTVTLLHGGQTYSPDGYQSISIELGEWNPQSQCFSSTGKDFPITIPTQ